MQGFACVRAKCAALRLLVPDDAWPQFEEWHSHSEPVAHHCSIAFAAFLRGHLARITAPIHKFLLSASGQPSQGVRNQYLQDLQERWMYRADPLDRHKKFRMFMGRVAELQVAEWLQDRGWAITGLEALREGPDIEADAPRPAEGAAAFEIKFIGAEDADFSQVVQVIAGESATESVSPYAASNYLLFKAFEASKQFANTSGRRICVVVVDDLAWWRFDCVVANDWIDWSAPSFLQADESWTQFLEAQVQKHPNLHTDLRKQIDSLDEIWLLRRGFGYEYHRVRNLLPHGA